MVSTIKRPALIAGVGLALAVGVSVGSPAARADQGGAQDVAYPPDLVSVMHMSSAGGGDGVGQPLAALRLNALKGAAMALGAQRGLAWQSAQIDADLQRRSALLDQIYDFHGLMLDRGMVLPPVIERAQASWSGTAQSASSTDVEYTIVEPAKILPVAPNWRAWLWMPKTARMQPDAMLLPKNSEERAAWEASVVQGWTYGVKQADAIFQVNVNRLTRDMVGMTRFMKLERRGMVSVPILGRSQPTIEVSGKMLAIGQKNFRLVSAARFTPAHSWQSAQTRTDLLPVGIMPDGTENRANDLSQQPQDIGFVGSFEPAARTRGRVAR